MAGLAAGRIACSTCFLLSASRRFPFPGRLLLADATSLGQPGGSGDDWRLHTLFNFSLGRLAAVSLTDQSGAEYLGRFAFQPGDIVVADGAYGYRKSIASSRKQQADLVTRIRPSTFPFIIDDGRTLDVVAQLRKRGSPVREWVGWCTDQHNERYRVRLVAAKLPAQKAAQARARARRNAQKHARTLRTETLLVAGWVLLVTTLMGEEWSAEEIVRLYRARWQIEVVFKRMKSVLGVGHLRGRRREALEASILAQLVGWALQAGEAARVREWLRQEVASDEWNVSGWKVSALSVDVLRQQVRGSWGASRVQACLPQLWRILGSWQRTDRTHQEASVRAWLERRPTRRLVIQQAV